MHFVHYNTCFDSEGLQAVVRAVHTSGQMYDAITENLEQYVHRNPGLRAFIERLFTAGKSLFMISNSPYSFMQVYVPFALAFVTQEQGECFFILRDFCARVGDAHLSAVSFLSVCVFVCGMTSTPLSKRDGTRLSMIHLKLVDSGGS